jgi:phosphoribosylamine---glycine ligase
MNILIIGNGGREHALSWKAAQNPKVTQVFVAPGNAGTALEHKVKNLDIAVDQIDALLEFAQKNQIDLTIVGPELPLSLGVVDRFEAAGLKIFGPSQACAQLESSKSFAKDFLKQNKIPTAKYETFTEVSKALAYLQNQSFPIVIKADGLAAGKGVIIAQTQEEAEFTVKDMLEQNRFGDAGAKIVIEEFLTGEEVSFIVMCDGEHALALATSQDHKARDDGDLGPNTGGMGAYSPAPLCDEAMHARVMQEVIMPTLNAMKTLGTPYKGFLYAGLMINAKNEPYVLEFNCRFGDPETQPILMRLKSDLVDLCMAGVEGRLDQVTAQWDPRTALGVVMAAGGYPDDYRKGDQISGLDKIEDEVKVFHAGTRLENDQVLTHGGRVLCVTALGKTVTAAQQKAYNNVKKIHWNGVYYRTDIGFKAIMRDLHQS